MDFEHKNMYTACNYFKKQYSISKLSSEHDSITLTTEAMFSSNKTVLQILYSNASVSDVSVWLYRKTLQVKKN